MTKLLIQIPCFNEEQTLPLVLQDIPKHIKGIDTIEIQVIDDGSSDKTVEVARKLGVHHIIQNATNQGLGNSFRIGMDNALRLGADILINTDGDNQYPSSYIPDLVRPILDGKADIVVGNRQTQKVNHFSPQKKFFQRLGTSVTRSMAGDPNITDAVSGFRSYNRKAMMELNVTSNFSYIMDTTIQAARKKLSIASIDITTNAPTRPSRLFNGITQHIRKSGMDLIRVYATYQPMRVFFWIGVFTGILGVIPLARFLYYYWFGHGSNGMIQSLIFGSILVMISANMFALGIIGDLQAKNRQLIEYIIKEMKKDKFDKE